MVLLPDKLEKDRRYPVLYVLQGSCDSGDYFGHPLREIKKHDLHNKDGLICVMPLRAKENWYTVAVKPTPADLRGDKYFVEMMVPFVEKQYPARAEINSRLLLGFSLSGVVAFNMVFRHPDTFGRAAAFDSPLDAPAFLQYLNDEAKVKAVKEQTRLIMIGYDVYRNHNKLVHEKLDRLQVPHVYSDGPMRKHRWDSGWVEPAVRLLVSPKLDGKVE
jgi:predicted alpha/beta superfamily hydrolase